MWLQSTLCSGINYVIAFPTSYLVEANLVVFLKCYQQIAIDLTL